MMDIGYWTSNGIGKSEKKNFSHFYRMIGSSLIDKKSRYIVRKNSDYNLETELIRLLENNKDTDSTKPHFAVYHNKETDEGYIAIYISGRFLNTSSMFPQPINMTIENINKIVRMCEKLGGQLHEISAISSKVEGSVRLKKVTLLDYKLVAACFVISLSLIASLIFRSIYL
ncbi:hypothetical protein ACPV54_14480 [Vibrio mediterranei]